MSTFIVARERDSKAIANFQNALGDDLINRLVTEGIVTSEADAVVREGLPSTDHGTTNNEWVTGSLTADTATNYVNNALGQRKYAAFYGIANRSSNPNVYEVLYKLGASGANTLDRIQIEAMYVELVTSGYISVPVLYKPNETIFIQVTGGVAQTEEVILRNFVAEPSGETSAPRLETRLR